MRAGHFADLRNLRLVKRIRSRLMRDHRVRSGMLDAPITGIAAIGLGVWLLAPEHEETDAGRLHAGVELLALGRSVHARQDFPSLRWQYAVSDAERDHPQLDVAAAFARAEALSLPQRTERLIEVVRSLRHALG